MGQLTISLEELQYMCIAYRDKVKELRMRPHHLFIDQWLLAHGQPQLHKSANRGPPQLLEA